MNGLGILFIGGIAVLFVVVAVVVMRAEDRRDPFGPEDDPGQAPGFGDMPPEIAHEPPRPSIHELPALGDAVWHQYPVTSPARFHPPDPREGEGPGTAAAAGDGTPPASPPPLPDPAYAAANPCHPFEWWQDEDFAEAMAAQDGTS